MTLEEKAHIVVGARHLEQNKDMAGEVGYTGRIIPGAAGTTYPIPRLGIPAIVVADGPAGLRISPTRKGDSQTYYCTGFPVGTHLAATWNDEIIYRVITMDETIAKTLSANNSVGGQYANAYRIYSDGTVDIPFLPPVKLEGLTEQEAQDTLCAAMRTIIPDADVKLAMYNKQFTVLGDAKSGTYTIYKDRLTIFQALAMTGDLMNSGDRRHGRIIRPRGNGEPMVMEFDIRPNSIINSEYYYIEPNDVLYIQKIKGQSFGINSAATTVSVVATTLAFGGFVYALVVRIMNAVEGGTK